MTCRVSILKEKAMFAILDARKLLMKELQRYNSRRKFSDCEIILD